jgi:hypothetical protein
MRWRFAVTLVTGMAVAGCSSIGPATIKRDLPDYSGTMASSWKEQMLLNIVKFRYFDPPVFLEVAGVVSQRELQTQGEVTSRIVPNPLTTSTRDFSELGVQGRYTDRPTISYTPLTGERFINNLLSPIPPPTIFAMIEAGHDVTFIFQIAVRAINGIYNASFSPARARRADPAFMRVAAAIRRLQRAGAISIRTEVRRSYRTGGRTERRQRLPSGTGNRVQLPETDTGRNNEVNTVSRAWIVFQHHGGAAAERDIRFVKARLRLQAGRDQFLLTYGTRRRPDEVAMLTRSMQEILTELAAGVEVPAEDLAEGRATPPSNLAAEGKPSASPLIRIHVSSEWPSEAFAVAHYRGRWYWIDDRDLRSKRVFMFLMIFSALSEARSVPQVPIVTIPTGG